MIFVLSAKYGLLDPDEEIGPYEMTLNNMSSREIKQWAQRVLERLKEAADINRDHFIFLAGEKYRKYLCPHLHAYDVPLQGLRIGEQLQKLKELTA
jgi:hypothetical protein